MAPKTAVMILGKTGNGKSLLANRILGVDFFTVSQEDPGNSKTRETVEPDHHEKNNYVVIDTPGFFESNITIDERWFEFLKAIRRAGQPIDVFVLPINVNQLSSGAACLWQLTERLGAGLLHRLVIVFTHSNNELSADVCNRCLDDFNDNYNHGLLGVEYMFSDQRASPCVLHDKMKRLKEMIQKIKLANAAHLPEDVIVRCTKQVLQNRIREHGIVSIEQLGSETDIDIELLQSFLQREDIAKIFRDI